MALRVALLVLLLFVLGPPALAQVASPRMQVLPSARLAVPATSGAVFSAGMSKDGGRSFVGSAAPREPVTVTALIRPEAGHIGQPASVYVVVMTGPGRFTMRNPSGAFVPWNGDVAALVPAGTVAALASQQRVDVYTGVLGSAAEFKVFVGYAAADKVLHYSSTPLTLRSIADSDGDGVPDTSDLQPLDASRTMAIAPAFPAVNGVLQFPDYPSTRQLAWILAQFAVGSVAPTDAALSARFTPAALTATPVATIQSLLQAVRAAHPGSVVIEPLTVTPTSFRGLIGIAGNPGSGRFLSFTTKYASGLIDSFSLTGYPLNAFFTTAENRTLTMAQAFDKLAAITPGTSLLVARIEDQRCVPIRQHNATTLRSTGSIFKTWVLAALGQAIDEGVISPNTRLPLVASEVARGSVLGSEPLGTVFPLVDMAVSMMGISDNTATDHVHELVGRARVEAIVRQFGHSAPERLTPFLSINEMFNLFSGVTAAQAAAYRDGSEAFQRNFLDTVLARLAPNTSGNDNYAATFFSAAWMASPMDVCAALAGIRQFNDRSPGFRMIDQALSSEAATVFLRNRWQRVWYKGGSLVNSTGFKVLTHSWLLESDSRGAFVVVSMHNDLSFTLDLSKSGVEWTLARVLQLVSDGSFE